MKQRKGKFWFPGENQRIGTTRYDWCNDDYYSRALYPLTLHAANNFVAQRDGRLISRDNPSPPQWFDSFRSIYATFETTFLNIPSRRSNRFLKIILQSCQSLRIRVDFYLRIFLLCSFSSPPLLSFSFTRRRSSSRWENRDCYFVGTVASFDVCEMEGLLEVKKNRRKI